MRWLIIIAMAIATLALLPLSRSAHRDARYRSGYGVVTGPEGGIFRYVEAWHGSSRQTGPGTQARSNGNGLRSQEENSNIMLRANRFPAPLPLCTTSGESLCGTRRVPANYRKRQDVTMTG